MKVAISLYWVCLIMPNNTGREQHKNILEKFDCGFHWPWKSACLTCIAESMCAMFKLILLLLKSMCRCKELWKHHKVSMYYNNYYNYTVADLL